MANWFFWITSAGKQHLRMGNMGWWEHLCHSGKETQMGNKRKVGL